MIPYLNRRQIESLVFLTLSIYEADNLAKEEVFKEMRGDINRGSAFLKKAYKRIMEKCQESDRRKYRNTMHTYAMKIVPKTKPEKHETIIAQEHLRDIAEYAIGKECVGCTKHDWKQCRLRTILDNVGSPAANDDANACQYMQ